MVPYARVNSCSAATDVAHLGEKKKPRPVSLIVSLGTVDSSDGMLHTTLGLHPVSRAPAATATDRLTCRITPQFSEWTHLLGHQLHRHECPRERNLALSPTLGKPRSRG